jgi:glycogen operon protein
LAAAADGGDYQSAFRVWHDRESRERAASLPVARLAANLRATTHETSPGDRHLTTEITSSTTGAAPRPEKGGTVAPQTQQTATEVALWPGQPYPLGATFDGAGVNFALFSEVAESVELCLFDDDGHETRHALPESTGFVHHGYVPGLTAGQRYGFRVHGPWDPARGLRCLPSKLLLDPYARAVEGTIDWNEAIFSYFFDDPERAKVNDQDSAPYMPRSVVVNPYFDWSTDRAPRRPLHETVIYETHVKGFTMRHPDIPEELRGTYAGLGHPQSLRYLNALGVTAIELLPVHQFVHDSYLVEKGLRNYWGYNSIGFFAPHNEYGRGGQRGDQVNEFKQMVVALHDAGIEVILDVVYNHTAEGNHLGPTLSFRGIDNQAYYRLVADDPQFYFDYTGTGNTFNAAHPYALHLIMDSLRYWVQEMHVDGFRFDLAATLGREEHAVERTAAFFDLIQQDPVVSQVKLIAEPWDVGEGGYQVGNFPPLWSEWNGKYRDSIRDYWRGEPSTLSEVGYRLTGSSDLYENSARRPHASINFATAHDGFTLADLVSYNDKHNEANLEGPGPGAEDNRSWNCGVEGPSDDPQITELRRRQQRNFLATLFLSQGVPMLLGGDEIGRTQQGNNNAYCQDNEISWYDWEHADAGLLAFTQRLIDLRQHHATFRRRRWFQGRQIHGERVTDVAWFVPDGAPMDEEHWTQASARAIGVFLSGDDLGVDQRGERMTDSTFFLMLNAADNNVIFTLPSQRWGKAWRVVLDTQTGEPPQSVPTPTVSSVLPEAAIANSPDLPSGDATDDDADGLQPGEHVELVGRSLVLLERVG